MEPNGPMLRPDTNPTLEAPTQPVDVESISDGSYADTIAWEASEHVYYEKDFLWLAGVVVAGLVLVALSWILMRSWSFALLAVVMMVAVIFMAYRPPRTLRYKIDQSGVHIEEKHYAYNDFRAFAVQQEGGVYSLMLIPIKRLMPLVSIYFPPDQGEEIIDAIGGRLPMEQIKPDLVDRLSKKLRF